MRTTTGFNTYQATWAIGKKRQYLFTSKYFLENLTIFSNHIQMKYVLCYIQSNYAAFHFKLIYPVSLYFGALGTGGERGVHIITSDWQTFLHLLKTITPSRADSGVKGFVYWYNSEHRHNRIKFFTPNQRHQGLDIEILENRKKVYQQKRNNHPERCSGDARN